LQDVLTTKPGEATANLPAPKAPIPRFITPWNDESSSIDTTHDDESESDQTVLTIIQPNHNGQDSIEPPPVAPAQSDPVVVTRSGRRVNPNPRYFNDAHANTMLLDSFSSEYKSFDHEATSLLQPVHQEEPHPLALLNESVFGVPGISSDPDTMTLEEAMNQPDRAQFIEAMKKELADHIERKHWKIMPAASVPREKRPIPMVWSMKRKRDPIGHVIKWKARLCAGGHRSIESVDYWSTYSPVVSWSTVRLIIVFALLNNWHMRSIDFILAFSQAPIKTDIYMKPPKVPPGFIIPDLPSFTDRFTNVYKLIKNLYGLKDAGKTWFEFLKVGLLKRGWRESEVDSCLFTKGEIILVVYVDDAILIKTR
jgi:hypothetical protein